jgi:hypothetical protein
MSNISVLIVSCDKYSDLWPIFFDSFFKNWHDFKMPIYLGSNFKEYSDKRVRTLKIGEDKDYSSNLIKLLSQIETEYVIVLVEDIIFSEKIDPQLFNLFLNQFLINDGIYFKLVYSYPLGYDESEDMPIGKINVNSRYRIGIGAGIWNKEWLLNTLPYGFSAWELEKDKTIFAKIPENRVYAINRKYKGNAPFKCLHGVIKGKWCRDSIDYIKFRGFSHELSGREIQPLSNYLYAYLFGLLMRIFIKFGFVWK